MGDVFQAGVAGQAEDVGAIELLQQVRADPALRTIRFIMVTAQSRAERVAAALTITATIRSKRRPGPSLPRPAMVTMTSMRVLQMIYRWTTRSMAVVSMSTARNGSPGRTFTRPMRRSSTSWINRVIYCVVKNSSTVIRIAGDTRRP